MPTGARLKMWFNGKHEQFEAMVRAYSTDLYRFAYWLARDRPLAEDAVQETYARAWKSWHQLKDSRAAKSWLFTILRHEYARIRSLPGATQVHISDDELVANLAAEPSEALYEWREAIMRLPPSYREPLLLQALAGFTSNEIASMMNLSEAAVSMRLSRARTALRKLIEPPPKRREVGR